MNAVADLREGSTKGFVRRQRGGRHDIDKLERRHARLLAGQVEHVGPFGDDLHLPLGESLGQSWIVGNALEELEPAL